MQLKEVLKNTSVDITGLQAEIEISNVCDNSKNVLKNSLFLAYKGNNSDGKKFASDAVGKGAKVILSDEKLNMDSNIINIVSKNIREDEAIIAKNFHNCIDEKMQIHAVTGTNGKTSTVRAIHHILNYAGIKTGYITTIDKSWDNITVPSNVTTPGALELYSDFYKMNISGCKACVMEASSHGIHQKRVHGIKFKTKVLTNITSDHLDYHETLEAYQAVKTAFLNEGDNIVILNLGDPVGSKSVRKTEKLMTYGINNSKADLNAFSVTASSAGTVLDIKYKSVVKKIQLPNIIGLFMAENILAAMLTALANGVDLELICSSIRSFVPPCGRLTKVETDNDFDVFVDYAHTTDSLSRCLVTLKTLAKNKLSVVFGCGGNRDKSKRPLMGMAACEIADRVIVTSDNPRFENPLSIIEDIKVNIKNNPKLRCEADRREAIFSAISEAQKGDVVVIAGKGHENYQEINGIRNHFSDIEAATEAIKIRNSK